MPVWKDVGDLVEIRNVVLADYYQGPGGDFSESFADRDLRLSVRVGSGMGELVGVAVGDHFGQASDGGGVVLRSGEEWIGQPGGAGGIGIVVARLRRAIADGRRNRVKTCIHGALNRSAQGKWSAPDRRGRNRPLASRPSRVRRWRPDQCASDRELRGCRRRGCMGDRESADQIGRSRGHRRQSRCAWVRGPGPGHSTSGSPG